MRIYFFGVAYLWILNMLDVYYTKTIMNYGNIIEANPMMDWVITNYGFTGLVIVKTFWIAMLLFGVSILYNNNSKMRNALAMLFWVTLVAYTALMGYHIALRALVG